MSGYRLGMDTSDKHGPRVDEELQKDTRAGADAREPLRGADTRPDVVQDQPGVLDDVDADRRAEVARYIEPSVFPARPSQLAESATANFASQPVIRALESLPDQVYENTQAVWQALGGAVEDKRG